MIRKSLYTSLLLCLAILVAGSCKGGYKDVIIPQPNHIEKLQGFYKDTGKEADVEITQDLVLNSEEGYELTVSKEGIKIKAGTEAGVFYAKQSLQLLIDEYGKRIPAQRILDAPRFGYRGVHLDVSRHFQGKDFVMKQLRMFASLKINTFHFHLTDGIGWRLQLDSHPELTETTAWKPAGYTYYTNDNTFVSEGTPGAIGGYFTKDDIREIVAFADSLHITVIPEIEMFGHSMEVFESHPELTCPVDNNGRKSSEFCLGNEATFEFLESVLSEVMELFPSEFIHIGGDEAGMRNWAVCPLCQARMKKEGLETVQELQSYGISRIEKFVNSKGRSIIGWEEIAKGGLAENAALMSWRGIIEGQKAAATGHKVIFCPEEFCYLDAYQDAPYSQPNAIGNYVPAIKTYSFDPEDGEFEGKEYIWGVQGNLWTEFIEKPEHAEFMYYPRVFALAEVGWTESENKNYDSWFDRAVSFGEKAVKNGYNVFDLKKEIGPRPGSFSQLHHLAEGCQIACNSEYSSNMRSTRPAIPEMLVDGHCGSWVNKYGGWLGFPGDADITLDFGKSTKIKSISTSFACFSPRGGQIPNYVVFEGSEDGENYTTLAKLDFNEKPENPDNPYCHDFIWKGREKVRYIHVIAHREIDESEHNPVPQGNFPLQFMRRKQIYVDEIIVR